MFGGEADNDLRRFLPKMITEVGPPRIYSGDS